MGVRAIFEVAKDGPSVIIWEGGRGVRVAFPADHMAERAANYLTNKANQFHEAREQNSGHEDELMVTVVCYGDVHMTEYEFIQDYKRRMADFGYEMQDGLKREAKEFW